LEIDHINGDIVDNRSENLRFLCPNCHATTPTYCRKKLSVSSALDG
jgi:predicted HNH restriction endonuclease